MFGRRQYQRVVSLNDPNLGTIAFNRENSWEAHVKYQGHDITILIDGGPSGPAPAGLNAAVQAVRSIDDHFRAAVNFHLKDLSPSELAKGPYVFRPTGIWSGAAWQVTAETFTLTMELEGDPDGLWRTEIGPKGPVDSGRDS